LNCQIWRASQDEFILVGGTLSEGGYLSFAGIWGIRTNNKRDNELPVFTDETSGDYYYMTDKGKNWKKFIALCPQLKQFELWDENIARVGTLEQEQCIYYAGLKDAPFNEQILELQKADLKEVDVATSKGTIFPSHFLGKTYLYGSAILKLPASNDIQIAFKDLCQEEAK